MYLCARSGIWKCMHSAIEWKEMVPVISNFTPYRFKPSATKQREIWWHHGVHSILSFRFQGFPFQCRSAMWSIHENFIIRMRLLYCNALTIPFNLWKCRGLKLSPQHLSVFLKFWFKRNFRFLFILFKMIRYWRNVCVRVQVMPKMENSKWKI